MNIFIAFAILSVVLILLILLICAYSYHKAFQAPPRSDKPYILPPGKAYIPFHEGIIRSAEEMLATPCEGIYLTAWDDTKLYARYYAGKPGTPVHIMMHGYKGSAYVDFCGGSKLARGLGHHVIVVDQRSQGKSEGRTITFGIKEHKDCLDWIRYAIERFGENTPVFLWGISMGASTVLMSAGLDLPKNVAGILADCPFSTPKGIIQKVSRDMHFPPKLIYPFIKASARIFGDFRLEECSALESVKHTDIPILLIHGQADSFVPHSMSVAIKEANPRIAFLSVPDAGHGLCYMVAPKEYEQTVLGFLENCLS